MNSNLLNCFLEFIRAQISTIVGVEMFECLEKNDLLAARGSSLLTELELQLLFET